MINQSLGVQRTINFYFEVDTNVQSNLGHDYSDSCHSEQGSIAEAFSNVTMFGHDCRWSSR